MKGLNVMKKLILLGIGAIPLSMVHSTPSDALIVECANCSDLAEQLLSDAKQAQQYVTQLQQYQTQLQQYQNMLQNTVTLPMSLWSQVQNDIMQVRNLTNAASLLTGNSGSILSRLQSAQGYASQASFLPQNIGSQFTMWQQTLGNASNSLGRTLGVQQGQEQNYSSLQAAINQHSQTATGQMQAIQAGNELASLTSTQLNQIQTTLTSAAQEQATRDDVQADRQALADAYTAQFLSAPYASLTGYPAYK
jgi:P-type conjugative transfer protein TrbJ